MKSEFSILIINFRSLSKYFLRFVFSSQDQIRFVLFGIKRVAYKRKVDHQIEIAYGKYFDRIYMVTLNQNDKCTKKLRWIFFFLLYFLLLKDEACLTIYISSASLSRVCPCDTALTIYYSCNQLVLCYTIILILFYLVCVACMLFFDGFLVRLFLFMGKFLLFFIVLVYDYEGESTYM